VQKIKFVGVVVFEKKRFEAIVDGNAYMYVRPWHKDRRRNSSVLKMWNRQGFMVHLIFVWHNG
jgi:hypothetical protein